MRLINSINLAGIASSTISNLEKMFGILGEVYLPKQYDGRTQHGDIEYQEEPFITKNFLFTNYIQNVVPSPGLKSFDIREEPLECYLPATDQISSIPKRSLVVLKTAHGEEKYVITQIEAMQGDLQTFIIKWGLIPSSISLDTPDELEENINIKESQEELYNEMGISSARLTFDNEEDYEPKSQHPEDLQGSPKIEENPMKNNTPDDVEVII
jgi:hypothetical protein